MRILKKAEQKNFRVSTDFYTLKNMVEMLKEEEVFLFNYINMDVYEQKELELLYETYNFDEFIKNNHPVVFAEDCKSVEVKYHKEFETYYTCVILKTGKEIVIDL